MFNMDLDKFLGSLEEKIIDKYNIKSFNLSNEDETEYIVVSFNRLELEKANVKINTILDYFINELENNNLKYKKCSKSLFGTNGYYTYGSSKKDDEQAICIYSFKKIK